MIAHIFKYNLKALLRDRIALFWILLFPIVLSTFFKIGFSNFEKAEAYSAIPVAVVLEDSDYSDAFKTVTDELSKEGDAQFLEVTYCDSEEAVELLKDKDVIGIITASDSVSLTISANMNNERLNQSILQYFVEQFNLNRDAITDIAMNHPDNLPAAAASTMEEASFNKEVSLSKQEAGSFDCYYYNLLAMACLFTATCGTLVSIGNQGNLSALGARKNIAPTHKLISIIGELLAQVIFNFTCNMIAFTYIVLVLKINLTIHLPFAILTMFVACITGIFFGFFIGAVSNVSHNTKIGIISSTVMSCCFLSGLMIGNMRIIVDMYVPFFNHINPAALISDSFYSLAVLDSPARYTQNMVTLLIIAALCCIGGFLLTRRKKYASL